MFRTIGSLSPCASSFLRQAGVFLCAPAAARTIASLSYVRESAVSSGVPSCDAARRRTRSSPCIDRSVRSLGSVCSFLAAASATPASLSRAAMARMRGSFVSSAFVMRTHGSSSSARIMRISDVRVGFLAARMRTHMPASRMSAWSVSCGVCGLLATTMRTSLLLCVAALARSCGLSHLRAACLTTCASASLIPLLTCSRVALPCVMA